MSEIATEKPFDGLNQKWALIALLCSLPVYFFFSQLGDSGRGRAAAICFAMGITAIRARWDLRNYRFFWIVAAAVVIVHIPPLFWISWSDKGYPGYTLLAPAVLDFGVYYGCILIVEKIAHWKGAIRGEGIDAPTFSHPKPDTPSLKDDLSSK